MSESDTYPMPRIDNLIDFLGTANYISTLDLTRGYWQVPLAEDARHKTAFVTPSGLYHFNVMRLVPFGLKGAPASLMDNAIHSSMSAAAYIDVIIFSTSTSWEGLREAE